MITCLKCNRTYLSSSFEGHECDEVNSIVVKELKHCARCNRFHYGMIFYEFRIKPEKSKYTHWALCPLSNEPIMMYWTEDDEEENDET